MPLWSYKQPAQAEPVPVEQDLSVHPPRVFCVWFVGSQLSPSTYLEMPNWLSRKMRIHLQACAGCREDAERINDSPEHITMDKIYADSFGKETDRV